MWGNCGCHGSFWGSKMGTGANDPEKSSVLFSKFYFRFRMAGSRVRAF